MESGLAAKRGEAGGRSSSRLGSGVNDCNRERMSLRIESRGTPGTQALATAHKDGYTLETKYCCEEGVVFLSGIQGLVRLPLDQHKADRRRGLNTATLISG